MDERLVGYALKALSPTEMAETAKLLSSDPSAVEKLNRLRKLLVPLAQWPHPEPPEGLAIDTIHRMAIEAVEQKLLQADPKAQTQPIPQYATDRSPVTGEVLSSDVVFEELAEVPKPRGSRFSRRWFEMGIAALVLLFAVGLGVTGLMKLRHQSQVAACQDQMRKLFGGLSSYADTHDDQFPKVGTPNVPTAGSFANELIAAGQLSPNFAAVCPTIAPKQSDLVPVSYAYTLGYRSSGGELLGIRRGVEGLAADHTPLVADLPAAQVAPHEGPVSPHVHGQNVLFCGGNVRFTKVATVGPDGDDIYRNQSGLARAGLHPLDASLGRSTDIP
jgi:hypothetical protein